MVKFLLVFICSFCFFNAVSADCFLEFKKIHFTMNRHKYFLVVGHCGGNIAYIIHKKDCPCTEGEYEAQLSRSYLPEVRSYEPEQEIISSEES